MGLRGPEILIEKPENTKRLMILGDSIVLGWGVEFEYTFPQLLQNLYKSDSSNIEVISVGVSSWNTRTEYEYLKSEAIKLEPDDIILIVVGNDADPKRGSNTTIDKNILFKNYEKEIQENQSFRDLWFFGEKYCYVIKYIQSLIKLKQEREYIDTTNERSPEWLDVEDSLDNLLYLCDANGIKLHPYLYISKEKLSNHQVLKLYQKYFNEKKITYYTFPDSLFNGYQYQNSVMDNHANVSGHVIIANKLLLKLNKNVIRN
jgi:lysophospholipase L1-like esterase